jgi:hypothetical protein
MPDPEPVADPSETEQKDAFRAALDRKRGKQHPHEGAGQGGSKIHEAKGAAGAKRSFRRKSG